jgi:plasmid stabilization system protein ParE
MNHEPFKATVKATTRVIEPIAEEAELADQERIHGDTLESDGKGQLLRLIARLWRACEEWIIGSNDLTRREVLEIARRCERLRLASRRSDALHIDELEREFKSLADNLPSGKGSELVSELIARIRDEFYRLTIERVRHVGRVARISGPLGDAHETSPTETRGLWKRPLLSAKYAIAIALSILAIVGMLVLDFEFARPNTASALLQRRQNDIGSGATSSHELTNSDN